MHLAPVPAQASARKRSRLKGREADAKESGEGGTEFDTPAIKRGASKVKLSDKVPLFSTPVCIFYVKHLSSERLHNNISLISQIAHSFRIRRVCRNGKSRRSRHAPRRFSHRRAAQDTGVERKELTWSARGSCAQALVPMETESEAWVEADDNASLQPSPLSDTQCAPSVPVPRMRARADMWPDMKPEPVREIVQAAATAALPSVELTRSASCEKTCVKLPTRAPVVMTRGKALDSVELGPAAGV